MPFTEIEIDPATGHAYAAITGTWDFNDALAEASGNVDYKYAGLFAHLAVITSKAEWSFIQSAFSGYDNPVYIAAVDTSKTYVRNDVWFAGPEKGDGVDLRQAFYYSSHIALEDLDKKCTVMNMVGINNGWWRTSCSDQFSMLIEVECPVGQQLTPSGCIGKFG